MLRQLQDMPRLGYRNDQAGPEPSPAPDTFATRIDALAGMRTRDIKLPADIMSAYLAHTWRSRQKMNISWMGWAAVLNVLCAALTPFIVAEPALGSVLLGRAAITAALVLGAVAIYLTPRPGPEGAITIATCLGMIAGAALMASEVEPQVAERYLVQATFLCGTAVAVSCIAWRDTLILAATVMIALAASTVLVAREALLLAEEIQIGLFFGFGIVGLVLARRQMNKIQQRIYVLGVKDKLKMDAIERANGRLHAIARTDQLTQVPNRRHFDEMFGTLEQLPQQRVALFMIDIDHFKRLNDALGHESGDECLKAVAGLIRSELRQEVDFVARFGGEEFVAVLTGLGGDEALSTAQRLRRAIEALGLPNPATDRGVVTVSIGVSVSPPASIDLLVAQADVALYEAKSSGRNAVSLSGDMALRVA